MVIDGLKKLDTRRVELGEFFDSPASVTIKILGPYAKAQIREVLMSGFSIGEMDTKGQKASVQTRNEGSADREIKIRELKLSSSFVSTDIKSSGVTPGWDKSLWDALDEANPKILEKVISEIDKFSKLNDEVESDPT
jgi:hypothetical protein